ncbi:unnamed protein product [Parnassius apollo]|uniref:(apollo) hypothetical protein n=1 Tax=Parnassius apollo TaxID=110799 RepID=A0A8S3X0A7_PARAO|nr:unnamed protein product [Parnassius apollo]
MVMKELLDESNNAQPQQNDSSNSQQNYSSDSKADETIKRVRRSPNHEIVSQALNFMKSVYRIYKTKR